MAKLPKKASELLQVALDDLIKIEKNPLYRVNMVKWHTGSWFPLLDKCEVCFAGAVMACTLKTRVTKNIVPDDFWKESDTETHRKLIALDAYRQNGSIYGFLKAFKAVEANDYVRRGFPSYIEGFVNYESSPETFKAKTKEAIAELIKAGL